MIILHPLSLVSISMYVSLQKATMHCGQTSYINYSSYLIPDSNNSVYTIYVCNKWVYLIYLQKASTVVRLQIIIILHTLSLILIIVYICYKWVYLISLQKVSTVVRLQIMIILHTLSLILIIVYICYKWVYLIVYKRYLLWSDFR